MRMCLKATLFVIPNEFKGRKQPVCDGYRPDWKVNPSNAHLNGGAIKAEESISPGESGIVFIYPMCEESWHHLKPEDQITMHEGSRLVGVAILQEVFWRQVPSQT
jgi:translation elongation factor EF-Tu-like GTPase